MDALILSQMVYPLLEPIVVYAASAVFALCGVMFLYIRIRDLF